MRKVSEIRYLAATVIVVFIAASSSDASESSGVPVFSGAAESSWISEPSDTSEPSGVSESSSAPEPSDDSEFSGVSEMDLDLSLASTPTSPSNDTAFSSTENPFPVERSFKFHPIPKMKNPGVVGKFRAGDKSVKFRVQRQNAGVRFTLPIRRKK